MSAEPQAASPPEDDAARFQWALQKVQPRPQCLLIAVTVIAAAFVAPAILLCGVASQQGIVWAIVTAQGVCAVALYRAGSRLEYRDLSNPRAGDFLMASILTLAAGLFLAALALEPGPWRERTLSLTTAAPIVVGIVALGVSLLLARARRISATQR